MTSNFNTAQSKQTADGFFSALFDFSFSQYITLKFARVIYLISAVLIGLCWVFGLLVSLAAFSDGFGTGLFALIGFLIVGTLVSLISARVTLEFMVSAIKTAQNTSEIAEAQRR
ncbi:DUF4282 domain-containing protein [Corynebacterium imitans]|uniref:DUF4282 domain-containing protein n=1 Tax=Corynebacterium imitans TaxID=156978 RepID=UPI00254C647E|nr:DUF4282 domain-containing protein [Corynebacterium imitans]MDK8307033.1 DUF4282 domain-containing protein [Corynebacterium imitans]MDK8637857.1 DUF4282 domain-containing protein [Corynebacterium imitans]MDK8772953.1 DUF4282 domain-containing protein [Corynebacterium imitans]